MHFFLEFLVQALSTHSATYVVILVQYDRHVLHADIYHLG